MKSQGKLDQFEAPTDDNNGLASESSLPEPTPTVETPAEPTPAPQMETEQDAAAQADGGDESVQDYMNQLFQRLRGEDAPEAAGAASPEPAPKTSEPTPKVEKKEVKETKEVQESQTQLPETPPARFSKLLSTFLNKRLLKLLPTCSVCVSLPTSRNRTTSPRAFEPNQSSTKRFQHTSQAEHLPGCLRLDGLPSRCMIQQESWLESA